VIARRRWGWSRPRAGGIAAVFLAIELAFLVANLPKITHGGWVPLVIASAIFFVMTTWRRGTRLLTRMLTGRSVPLDRFFAQIEDEHPPRVPGTAVFLTAHTGGTPEILIHHLRHNKALHERIIFLSITPEDIPEVAEAERLEVERLPHGFYRVVAHYGFMETPNVASAVARCCRDTFDTGDDDVTYYLGRPTLLPTGRTPMMRWRKILYAFLARNARAATQFFGIPPTRVVELGMQVEF
jgi:KUP system potassium uptake protein